jgi:hypothetical protein
MRFAQVGDSARVLLPDGTWLTGEVADIDKQGRVFVALRDVNGHLGPATETPFSETPRPGYWSFNDY